jgi:hypothetical protein
LTRPTKGRITPIDDEPLTFEKLEAINCKIIREAGEKYINMKRKEHE